MTSRRLDSLNALVKIAQACLASGSTPLSEAKKASPGLNGLNGLDWVRAHTVCSLDGALQVGWTALHGACSKDAQASVEMLLGAGADIEVEDKVGPLRRERPLFLALLSDLQISNLQIFEIKISREAVCAGSLEAFGGDSLVSQLACGGAALRAES